jgi:hypothetical protein
VEIGGHLTYFSLSLLGIKASAKLRLGIYYLRKSVFLIFLNNHLTDYYTMTYCLRRKNKKRFLSFQSMPNLNFAELICRELANPELKEYACPIGGTFFDELCLIMVGSDRGRRLG